MGAMVRLPFDGTLPHAMAVLSDAGLVTFAGREVQYSCSGCGALCGSERGQHFGPDLSVTCDICHDTLSKMAGG